MHRIRRSLLSLEALVSFQVFELALRNMTFENLLARLVKRYERFPRRSPGPMDEALLADLSRLGKTLRRLDFRSRLDCLPRALTIYRLARRRGLEAAMVIGVKKPPFSAHAWVEIAGEVVSDFGEEAGEYTVMMSTDSRRSRSASCASLVSASQTSVAAPSTTHTVTVPPSAQGAGGFS